MEFCNKTKIMSGKSGKMCLSQITQAFQPKQSIKRLLACEKTEHDQKADVPFVGQCNLWQDVKLPVSNLY